MSTTLRTGLVAAFALVAPAAVFAQNLTSPAAAAVAIPYDDQSLARAPYVIFSNLEHTPGAAFQSDRYFDVAGRKAPALTENWDAIRFIPKVTVQATVLSAAVTYTSGTRLVNIGLYRNDDITGSVGEALPGGQVSTTDIPDAGECCQLTTVTLPGEGVTLMAGTVYWLVVGPDNVNAPTFQGRWDLSFESEYAYLDPLPNWFHPPGEWPAAEIRGTRVGGDSAAPARARASDSTPEARGGKAVIFTNLDRAPDSLYLAGTGGVVAGNEAFSHEEAWLALPFTPKADVHAKTLAAAISYVSGTRLANLGIYSDKDDVPGTLLPGGQASTSDIPDNGECCELTTVTLPGAGVALTAGTKYWLVASPDNVNAPSFYGLWQKTGLAIFAYQEPELFLNWTSLSGGWQAAEIRGSVP